MKQRKVKRVIACLLLFCLLPLFPVPGQPALAGEQKSEEQTGEKESGTAPQKDPGLYAKAAVLIDGENNRILYGKNQDTVMPNASTTKILTCILAVETGKMDQICTASEYACKMPETKCGFAKGDQFYLKDLLYSLMLESHNDSAVVIAETLGGSVENFSKMMNDKAKELGCENSHFVTPNGLDGSDAGGDHGSTAYDLAKIMSYCIKNDTFLEITQAKNHTFTDLKKEHTYQLSNKNSFLSMQKGAVSGKTGYTAKAGYCYVCAYKDNGRIYALALLACGWPNHKSYKWSDSKKLIAYGNENYKEQVIDRKEDIPGIRITGGVKKESGNYEFPGTVSLKEEEKEISCLVSDSDQISITYECPDILKAPLKKGQEAGTAKYFINDTYIGSKKLFVNEEVTAFDLGWCLKQFLQEFLQKASI